MGMKHAKRYCPKCDGYVLAVGDTPNHILHLILTIVTGGLWGLVWMLLLLKRIKWYCTECKTETELPPQANKVANKISLTMAIVGAVILILIGALCATAMTIFVIRDGVAIMELSGMFLVMVSMFGGAFFLVANRKV